MGGRPAGQTTPPTPPPRTELAGNRTCTPRGKNRPSTALGSNPASRTTAGLFLTNFHLGNRFEAPHSQLVSGIVSQCVRGGGAREHVPTTTPEPAVAPPPSTSGSLPPPRAAGHLGCSHPAERPPTPATGHGHLGCSPTAERPPRPSGTSGASPFPPPERHPQAARVPGDEANMAAPGEARGRWLTSRRRRAGGGASRTADPGGPPRPRRRPRPPARAHAGRGRSLGPGWGSHSSPAACLPDTPARGPHRCTGRPLGSPARPCSSPDTLSVLLGLHPTPAQNPGPPPSFPSPQRPSTLQRAHPPPLGRRHPAVHTEPWPLSSAYLGASSINSYDKV